MDCPECVPSPWWHLFDSSPFMPRYLCGDWPAWMVNAWVLPSLLICGLYLTVAVWQFRRYLAMKGTDYPRWSALTVGLLFAGCAGGHLCNAAAFHWPAYRFFVAWDWLTLFASVAGWHGLHAQDRWNQGKYRRALTADEEKRYYLAHAESEKLDKQRLRIQVTVTETENEVLKQKLVAAETELGRLRLQLGGA